MKGGRMIKIINILDANLDVEISGFAPVNPLLPASKATLKSQV